MLVLMLMIVLVLVALHAGMTSQAVSAGMLRLRVDLGRNVRVVPGAGDRRVVGVVAMVVSVMAIVTTTRVRSVRLRVRHSHFIKDLRVLFTGVVLGADAKEGHAASKDAAKAVFITVTIEVEVYSNRVSSSDIKPWKAWTTYRHRHPIRRPHEVQSGHGKTRRRGAWA